MLSRISNRQESLDWLICECHAYTRARFAMSKSVAPAPLVFYTLSTTGSVIKRRKNSTTICRIRSPQPAQVRCSRLCYETLPYLVALPEGRQELLVVEKVYSFSD